MLERLLQAAVITLLLSLIAGLGEPHSTVNSEVFEFRAFSPPVANPQLYSIFSATSRN